MILSIEKGKLLPESEEFREQRNASHDIEEEVGSAKVHHEDRSEECTSGLTLDLMSNSDRLLENRVSKDVITTLLL